MSNNSRRSQCSLWMIVFSQWLHDHFLLVVSVDARSIAHPSNSALHWNQGPLREVFRVKACSLCDKEIHKREPKRNGLQVTREKNKKHGSLWGKDVVCGPFSRCLNDEATLKAKSLPLTNGPKNCKNLVIRNDDALLSITGQQPSSIKFLNTLLSFH